MHMYKYVKRRMYYVCTCDVKYWHEKKGGRWEKGEKEKGERRKRVSYEPKKRKRKKEGEG